MAILALKWRQVVLKMAPDGTLTLDNHLEKLISINQKSLKNLVFGTGKMAFTLCPVCCR